MNALSKAAVAASLACAGCLSGAGDAAAADVKIGFVSTERVLRESAPAVRSLRRIEREFEKRVAELTRMEQQIRELRAQIERDSATISETDRRNRERDLSNLTLNYQRNERSLREDRNARANEELLSLQERADRIIKQIADQEKFDLILQEPVVWASPRIDITDRVIKLLADK